MPIFDDNLLAFLPKESRKKIERLDIERDATIAAMHAASDAIQEARQAHATAVGRAKERAAQYHGSGFMVPMPGKVFPDGPPTPEQLKATIQEPWMKTQRELDRAQTAYDLAGERFASHAFMEATRDWLARYRANGGKLAHAPLPPVASTVKAALRQEVESVRKQLAALDHAWRVAEQAPCDRADFKARALQEIEALAAAGAMAPDLRNRGPNPLNLRRRLALDLQRHGSGADAVHLLTGDPSAMWVWLHRDALLAKINAAIDAADDAGAMTYTAREKEFARISRERLTLEFREESCIVAAERDGQMIARRRDADPRAVLEVQET